MEDKRCYSLNQAAYLIMLGYTYQIKFDEETARFYLVFPESGEIYNDIKEYKSKNVTVNLFGFTRAYKKIRDEIRSIRFSEEFGVKYSLCKIRTFIEKSAKNIQERFPTREEQEAYINDLSILSEEELEEKYYSGRVD